MAERIDLDSTALHDATEALRLAARESPVSGLSAGLVFPSATGIIATICEYLDEIEALAAQLSDLTRRSEASARVFQAAAEATDMKLAMAIDRRTSSATQKG